MRASPRLRFWLEMVLMSVSTGLLALTLFQRAWIEVLFGIDPDQGSGAVEQLVVATLLTAVVAAAFLARREWRRYTLAPL